MSTYNDIENHKLELKAIYEEIIKTLDKSRALAKQIETEVNKGIRSKKYRVQIDISDTHDFEDGVFDVYIYVGDDYEHVMEFDLDHMETEDDYNELIESIRTHAKEYYKNNF